MNEAGDVRLGLMVYETERVKVLVRRITNQKGTRDLPARVSVDRRILHSVTLENE